MIAKKKSSLLLTLGATGLLIGGGVAAYWVLIPRNGLPHLPVGANIIPQNALLTISVSTEPNQWHHLREFGTKATQAELDRQLTSWRDRFLSSNGYDYQQDIQPWIGKEATLAFLPQLTPTSNSTPEGAATKEQSFVMVLPIDNPLRAQQLLQPNSLKQGKWIESSYKNIKIEQSQNSNQNYSVAVLDRHFLVLANNLQATKQAIDTYKGGVSLATTPGYTEALGKITSPVPFAKLYLNIPIATKFALENAGQPVVLPVTKLQAQGLATTVTLQSGGIEFKSISWLQPNSSQKYVVENKAGVMPSRLPANTLMMVSGGNLQQLWQDYLLSSQSNPNAPIPPENLRSNVNSVTGLDLDRDLLSWMKGEFSLSLIPPESKVGVKNNLALSLLFTIQTSDRTRAEKTFQQLDKVVSSRYQFQVQSAQVGSQPIVNWISPYGLTATHGWLDGDVAFLSIGAPVAERIVPKPATTLASSEQFQKTVPAEPSPNNGQLFLDLDRLLKTFPLSPSLEQQPFVEAIRSIGITTAVSDERSIRYNIFVSLKQTGKEQVTSRKSQVKGVGDNSG